MKVVVVIPTHDRLQFVDEAIASVKAQTRPPDELVITGNVGPGVITDAPLADRLNDAIERSECGAFLMLSDDDKLDRRYIEKTLAVMESTSADVVYTDMTLFGDRTGRQNASDWSRQRIDDNNVPPVTSLYRRSAWEKAGRYCDVPFFDWDFAWRCFYAGAKAEHLHEPLFWYRHHAGSESNALNLQSCRAFILARHEMLRNEVR